MTIEFVLKSEPNSQVESNTSEEMSHCNENGVFKQEEKVHLKDSDDLKTDGTNETYLTVEKVESKITLASEDKEDELKENKEDQEAVSDDLIVTASDTKDELDISDTWNVPSDFILKTDDINNSESDANQKLIKMNKTDSYPIDQHFQPIKKDLPMTNVIIENGNSTSSSSTESGLPTIITHDKKNLPLPFNDVFTAMYVSGNYVNTVKNVWNKKAIVDTVNSDYYANVVIPGYYTHAEEYGKHFHPLFEQYKRIFNIRYDLKPYDNNSARVMFSGDKDAITKIVAAVVYTPIEKEIVDIPKEYFGYLLGKGGMNRIELEKKTKTIIVFPKLSDISSIIRVKGSEKNVNFAIKELKDKAEKKMNRISMNVQVEKQYIPFVKPIILVSPNYVDGEVVIRFPKQSEMSDMSTTNLSSIYLIGNKDLVKKLSEEITIICNEKKIKNHKVSVHLSKEKQKLLVKNKGNFKEQIFRNYNVMMDYSHEDEYVHLFGEANAISDVVRYILTTSDKFSVYFINAPQWTHRFIKTALPVEFGQYVKYYSVDTTGVLIEGVSEEVEKVREFVANVVDDILVNKTNCFISAPTRTIPHIIGKGGATTNGLKSEFNVIILIHDRKDEEINGTIEIVGDRNNVYEVTRRIESIMDDVINHIHETITLKFYIRNDDQFKYIMTRHNKLVKTWFENVDVYKDTLHIVGNSKAVTPCLIDIKNHVANIESTTVEKIINVTNPQNIKLSNLIADIKSGIGIHITMFNSTEIFLCGSENKLNSALSKIESVVGSYQTIEHVKIVVTEVIFKIILSRNNAFITDFKNKMGVTLDKSSNTTLIVLSGLKSKIAGATKQLNDYIKKMASSYIEEIPCNHDHGNYLYYSDNSFLKGKEPSTFCYDLNNKDSIIVLVGTEEQVSACREKIKLAISSLSTVCNKGIDVDVKYHSIFFIQKRLKLTNIMDETFNLVNIKFPKDNSKTISFTGPSELVEMAINLVKESVDIASRSKTKDIEISTDMARVLKVRKGGKYLNLYDIKSRYNITAFLKNQDGKSILSMSGLMESIIECENEIKKLSETIPISQVFNMDIKYHSAFIGVSGKNINFYQRTHNVRINMPDQSSHSSSILIEGEKVNVKDCINHIESFVEEESKKVTKKISDVEEKYVKSLYDYRVIKNLRTKYDVNITSRTSNGLSDFEITGLEQQVNLAVVEINKKLNFYENTTQKIMEVDTMYHPRLIGSKGVNVIRLNDDFNVKVNFPKRDAVVDKNKVKIVGLQNDIDKCVQCINDLLKNMGANINGTPVKQNHVMKSASTNLTLNDFPPIRNL
ncbi:hypothetical protein A3Q56_03307 [Intoshia linei]|uniref:K Homology domain-containing protein n=1 Tax=Intoshia linei TaxID=1819745 RepID=A0A177B3U6_9BILA|nr:hypothetical protein A3Q56_03307 [Intoshia linei]